MKAILSLALLLIAAIANAAPTPFTLNTLFEPVGSGSPSAIYTFSGANGDSVNYLQFCNLGTSCNSGTCTGQYTVIDSGTPLTNGTPYHFSQQFFTRYLQANGLTTAGDYYIGLYAQSTHWNCTSSTNYCGALVDDTTTQPLCIKATYDGTNVTNLDQIDNGSAPLAHAIGQYFYVSDQFNEMFLCTPNSNGTLNTCANAGGTFGGPNGIAAATIQGVQYIYVADFGSNTVKQCSIDSTSGAFNSCTTLTPASITLAFANPASVAVAYIDGTPYAYVGDGGNQNTYQCTLNSDGSFNVCTGVQKSTNSTTWAPTGITAATFNGTAQYLYVVDNSGYIYNCPNGVLANCSAASSPAFFTGTYPNAMAFVTLDNTPYAYVATRSGLAKCTIDTGTGNLGTCSYTPSSGAPSWNPLGVSVTSVNGTQYAYVTSPGPPGQQVYQCAIITTPDVTQGDLSSCSLTSTGTDFGMMGPYGITSAYVVS